MNGVANLRIDCSRLEPAAIRQLAEMLKCFIPIQIVGGDLILVKGKINSYDYSNVWKLLDFYDVTVE